MPERLVITRSPGETRRFAAVFAEGLKPGDVLALHGELGSGKTCFVQGLAEGLAVRDAVHSPTFNLISEHAGRVPLYHVDLYRLRGAAEAEDAGLDEYLYGDGVTAIEWAERADELMPARSVHIHFRVTGAGDEREIRVVSP